VGRNVKRMEIIMQWGVPSLADLPESSNGREIDRLDM
jgi:hypothetical protein